MDVPFGPPQTCWRTHGRCSLSGIDRSGPSRFAETRGALPGVTEKVLSAQLRELERDGVIQRTRHRDGTARVDYRLSDAGHGIAPGDGGYGRMGDQISRGPAETASSSADGSPIFAAGTPPPLHTARRRAHGAGVGARKQRLTAAATKRTDTHAAQSCGCFGVRSGHR